MKLQKYSVGNTKMPIIVALIIGLAGGVLISNYTILGKPLQFKGADKNRTAKDSVEKEPLYWVAPMDPNYRRDEAGKSPMGMDLVPVFAGDSSSNDDSNTVSISAVVEQNLGVRTSKAERRSLWRKIEATGYQPTHSLDTGIVELIKGYQMIRNNLYGNV